MKTAQEYADELFEGLIRKHVSALFESDRRFMRQTIAAAQAEALGAASEIARQHGGEDYPEILALLEELGK